MISLSCLPVTQLKLVLMISIFRFAISRSILCAFVPQHPGD
jgi:hypothetical protein